MNEDVTGLDVLRDIYLSELTALTGIKFKLCDLRQRGNVIVYTNGNVKHGKIHPDDLFNAVRLLR